MSRYTFSTYRLSSDGLKNIPILAIALAVHSAWAVEPTSSNQAANVLPVVEVNESAGQIAKTKITTDNAALPASVTTITSKEITRINVTRDISDVFRRVPGVVANNIDQGDTGNGFRMRGFATQGTHGADTAVYVDGVPQNVPSSQGGAGHGPVFLEWMVPQMMNRIDVIKGPVSALYGDQNRAGSVSITTKNGGAATPSSVGASVESYGGRRLSIVDSREFDDVQSLFIADLYRSDSYRNGVDNNRDNLFWKLSKTIGDGLYSIRASYYKSDFTAAGYLSVPALQAGLNPKSVQSNNLGFGDAKRTSLVFNRTPARGEAGWYATAYVEQFERVRGITASANSHNVGVDDRTILGGRIANNIMFDDKASLFVGVDVRQDKGDATRQVFVNRTPSANWVNNQDLDLLTYGVFAQGQYLVHPSLKLLAGARYDKFDYSIANRKLPGASTDYNDSVFTPKYGAVWGVTSKVDIFANIAQGFRSPAAEQLSSSGTVGPLGSAGGRANTGISPTKVRSYDLGFNAKPMTGLLLSGAVYQTINEDEIVNTAPDVFTSVGDTTREGFELESQYQLNSSTSLYGSYGRIITARVNNPTPGTNPDLSVPRHQYKAGIEHRMALSAGRLILNADAYLTSGNPYYSGAPLTKKDMPTYSRYDVKATYDYKQTQTSLYAVFQPHKYGTEVAYGSAAGLLISPQPGTFVGVSFRYFY